MIFVLVCYVSSIITSIMPLTCCSNRLLFSSFCHLDSEGEERKEDEEEEDSTKKIGDNKNRVYEE